MGFTTHLSIDVNQRKYILYIVTGLLSVILSALYSINTFVQGGFKSLYTQIYIYNAMLAYNTHGFKSVGF